MSNVKVGWESQYTSGHFEFTAPYEFAAIEIVHAIACKRCNEQITVVCNDEELTFNARELEREVLRHFFMKNLKPD